MKEEREMFVKTCCCMTVYNEQGFEHVCCTLEDEEYSATLVSKISRRTFCTSVVSLVLGIFLPPRTVVLNSSMGIIKILAQPIISSGISPSASKMK